MSPNFPLIIFYDNSLDLISDESKLSKATTLTLINGKLNNVAYDVNFKLWTYKIESKNIKNNFVTKLLANTIYNPIINVETIWDFLGDFEINDLKNKLNTAIDNDDDILTQFVEADILKEKIKNENKVENIYAILLKNVFNFTE